MDLNRLHQILNETTVQLRKGEVFNGSPHLVEAAKAGRDITKEPGGVLVVDAMPHESEAAPKLDKVDCHFLTIGVDREKAEQHRVELIEILKTYPNPAELAGGPSYINLGAQLGDQGMAFQLFALGKTLNLWNIVTPASFGFTGNEADEAASFGFVMITGFKQAA